MASSDIDLDLSLSLAGCRCSSTLIVEETKIKKMADMDHDGLGLSLGSLAYNSSSSHQEEKKLHETSRGSQDGPNDSHVAATGSSPSMVRPAVPSSSSSSSFREDETVTRLLQEINSMHDQSCCTEGNLLPSKKSKKTTTTSAASADHDIRGDDPIELSHEKALMPKLLTNQNIKDIASSSSNNLTMYNRPYKKFHPKSALQRGWLETAFRMGVTRPVLYLSKRATQTDTNPSQHRFQLTKVDIDLAAHASLRALAQQAETFPVVVNVLDRNGNVYEMMFKYLESSQTYRFMGPDYTKFLIGSKLQAYEILDIWGLPIDHNRGRQGEHWLAFINSSGDQRTGINIEAGREGVNQLLPALGGWKVKL